MFSGSNFYLSVGNTCLLPSSSRLSPEFWYSFIASNLDAFIIRKSFRNHRPRSNIYSFQISPIYFPFYISTTGIVSSSFSPVHYLVLSDFPLNSYSLCFLFLSFSLPPSKFHVLKSLASYLYTARCILRKLHFYYETCLFSIACEAKQNLLAQPAPWPHLLPHLLGFYWADRHPWEVRNWGLREPSFLLPLVSPRDYHRSNHKNLSNFDFQIQYLFWI